MGFYSIFKTIRLIVKDLFGNKVWRIILIVAIVLILYLFLTNKTFAYTSSDSSQENGTSYSVFMSEQLAMSMESTYQKMFLQLMQQYEIEYNDKFEMGNEWGYIHYLLSYSSTVGIFCTPSTINRYFGSLGSNTSSTSLTVILYLNAQTGVNYNPVSDADSTWIGISDLTVMGMYGTSDFPASVDDIDNSSRYVAYWTFNINSGECTDSGFTTSSSNTYLIPQKLYWYMTDELYNYLFSDTTTNTDIVSAIQSSTDDIVSSQNATKQAIDTLKEDLFSDNTDDEALTTSLTNTTSSTSTDIDSEGIGVITTIITTLLDKIASDDYNTVTQIEIPLINDNSIVIRSDVVSAHINDTLTNLISVFWYSVFCIYLLRFVLKLSHQIATLEFVKNRKRRHSKRNN